MLLISALWKAESCGGLQAVILALRLDVGLDVGEASRERVILKAKRDSDEFVVGVVNLRRVLLLMPSKSQRTSLPSFSLWAVHDQKPTGPGSGVGICPERRMLGLRVKL